MTDKRPNLTHATGMVASASLIETWIDEAEQRAWFLGETAKWDRDGGLLARPADARLTPIGVDVVSQATAHRHGPADCGSPVAVKALRHRVPIRIRQDSYYI
jgi:hypothetical protein